MSSKSSTAITTLAIVQVTDRQGRRYNFSEAQWKARENHPAWHGANVMKFMRYMEVVEPHCEASPSNPCDCGE